MFIKNMAVVGRSQAAATKVWKPRPSSHKMPFRMRPRARLRIPRFPRSLNADIEDTTDHEWLRQELYRAFEAGSGPAAFRIFHKMEDMGLVPDVEDYHRLMKLLRESGDCAGVLDLYKEMKLKRLPMREGTYTILLKTCSMLKDLERGKEFFNELRRNDYLELNYFHYSAMIDICIRCNAIYDGLQYLQQMKLDGMDPNVKTYTSLINGLTEMENRKEAARLCDGLLREMDERNVEKNVITYATAIGVYGRAKESDKVVALYNEASESGVPRDIAFYHSILRRMSLKPEDFEMCMEVYEEMKQDGFVPVEFTYLLLLRSCSTTGNVDRAMELYQEMKDIGFSPHLYHYNSILRCYFTDCKNKGVMDQLEKAEKIVQDMEANKVELNEFSFNQMIKLCANCGDLDKGLQYFSKMKEKGVRPSVLTYTNMINLFRELADEDNAGAAMKFSLQLMHEMKKDQLPVDAPFFTAMFRTCAMVRNKEVMRELVDEVERTRVRRTVYLDTAIIRAWNQCGEVDKALGVLHNMLRRGPRPNVVTFTVIIEALLESGRLKEIMDVLKTMITQGAEPNDVTKRILRRIDQNLLSERERLDLEIILKSF